MLTLYGYYRSSAAYRVRIVLGLKGISCEQQAVNLLKGEQREAAYLQVNPQGLVPALQITDAEGESVLLTQSLAIIEYLEALQPSPALLPADILAKAQVRSLAQQVAVDMHPLNNLRVLKYLQAELDVSPEIKTRWYQDWIASGFAPLEESLQRLSSNGRFCFGDTPTLADVCLIPQVYNARRFDCDMASYPLIESIWQHCNSLPAFQQALPEAQPDCPQ